ncbi:MAG: hypothetical protein K0B05_11495 [Bacteroidales bacterium]|nr:hypothetical protein [Bacteroidales bacterium]
MTFLSAPGQEITVMARFDTTRILIGDQVSFSLIVDKPAGASLFIPLYADTLTKNVEILSGPVTDSTVTGDGRIKLTQKYLVTSFFSGQYQINPVYAETKEGNIVRRFYSDYTYLEVLRVNIAPSDTTAKIFDIIQPYRAPLTDGEILPWVLAAIIGFALIYFLVRYLRKLKTQKREPAIVVNPDPAHITAFRELEKLKGQELWQKGETKRYYTRLTEILRQYLEDRFRVFSLELTTEETLKALKESGFRQDNSFVKLKGILTHADLVKFAKHKPPPEENESSFENSWQFVDETKEEEIVQITEKGKEEKP